MTPLLTFLRAHPPLAILAVLVVISTLARIYLLLQG